MKRSIRLSDDTNRAVDLVRKHLGITATAFIEQAIAEHIRQIGPRLVERVDGLHAEIGEASGPPTGGFLK